jgi:hypothetical protein
MTSARCSRASRAAGFTGVAVAEDVHADSRATSLLPSFIFIAAPTFSQVTAVGGDGSEGGAQNELKAVQQAIDNVKSL